MAATRTLADAATILERHINMVKYTIFCLDVILWILAASMFVLSVDLRLDSTLEEWLDILNIREYYIGSYVLIFTSVLMLIIPVFSCIAVYQEIAQLLLMNAAANAFCFLLMLIGSTVMMETSAVDSGVQATIRETMTWLIVHSNDFQIASKLNKIQQDIGCCGADGSNDYMRYNKPLPTECRDTVTGNPYFHGCTDEVIWMLQDKCYWITTIAITCGGLQMLITVLSYILIQALQKEEKLAYR